MMRKFYLTVVLIVLSMMSKAQDDVTSAFENSFPSEINIAHTWNRSLVKKAGQVLGAPYREDYDMPDVAVDLTVIDCNARRPVLGNFSESPYLTAELGVEMVKGLQLNDELKADILINPKELSSEYVRPFMRVKLEAKTRGQICTYNKGEMQLPVQFNPADTSQVYADAAFQVARESVVLLKNAGSLLPVSPSSVDTLLISCPQPYADMFVSELSGILGDSIHIRSVSDKLALDSCSIVDSADLIIVFQGDHRRESMLKTLVGKGKPVVLVLLNTRPVSLKWEKTNIPAIIEAWHPGRAGVKAISQVLCGVYNPGGRLTLSFPDYALGCGIGYSQIRYSDLQIEPVTDKQTPEFKVRFSVTNLSDRDAAEVVQVYLTKPGVNASAAVRRLSNASLEACKRTNIKAGETKQMSFTLRQRNFDQMVANQLTTLSGIYRVGVGAASDDIRLNGRLEIK